MFEDSTFESNGRIRTRSRGWMIAALALNSSIVFALILIPLIYPEALPKQFMTFLMEVPPPPPATPTPPHQPAHASSTTTAVYRDPFAAPRQIPPNIVILDKPEPAPLNNVASLGTETSVPGGIGDAFGPQPTPRVVPLAPKGPTRVPSSIAAGLLIRKVIPQYPPLARAARVEGTVVLAATISKEGTIINLRVVSGPPMLQQAALDAVSQWRYRPYLLNGEPVDVETTVNVIFTLGG
jgi:protein TonB